MVIPMRPAKFYGSSLPRPQFYTDVKFNKERVDPPQSILDPLLSWAQDAHWSMGGLSFQRVRHQGVIEGNLKKLKAEGEKRNKKNDELKIEMLRAEEEKIQKVEEERIQKAEEEKIQKAKAERAEKEKGRVGGKLKKKKGEAKSSVVEEKVEKQKKRGKGSEKEAASGSNSPSESGIRRSKRRKLVLRDEDDEVEA